MRDQSPMGSRPVAEAPPENWLDGGSTLASFLRLASGVPRKTSETQRDSKDIRDSNSDLDLDADSNSESDSGLNLASASD